MKSIPAVSLIFKLLLHERMNEMKGLAMVYFSTDSQLTRANKESAK